MASKNDQNFIAFCDELRQYVEKHHYNRDWVWHSLGKKMARYSWVRESIT